MNEGEIHSISMSKSKSKVASTSMQELASSELAKPSLNIFILVYHMPTGTSHSRLLSTYDQLGVMLRHFRCCFPFSVTVIEAQLNSNSLVPSPPLLLTKWPRKGWSGIFGPIPWLSPSQKKIPDNPFHGHFVGGSGGLGTRLELKHTEREAERGIPIRTPASISVDIWFQCLLSQI